MSVETQAEVPVKVVSDGNQFHTVITANGQQIENVVAIHWDIEAGEPSRMVLEMDLIGVEYEGGAVMDWRTPTLREVLGIWWRGRKRKKNPEATA
jgi:hypothetical protein